MFVSVSLPEYLTVATCILLPRVTKVTKVTRVILDQLDLAVFLDRLVRWACQDSR